MSDEVDKDIAMDAAEEEALLDKSAREIPFTALDLTIYEPLEDYTFLAPSPPYKEGYYITHIADIKLGFGARYYLVKALQKIKAIFYDSENIPLWAIEVDKLPKLTKAINRRRGSSWLSGELFTQIPVEMAFSLSELNPGSIVRISDKFPTRHYMYQPEISRLEPEKWDKFQAEAKNTLAEVQTRAPIGTSSSKVWVRLIQPILGISEFGFEREDLKPVEFVETKAYKIRDIPGKDQRRPGVFPGSIQQPITEIAEGTEKAIRVHNETPGLPSDT